MKASTRETERSYYGPVQIGGRYLCAYWNQEYEVLGFKEVPQFGESIVIRWADGREATHNTAWDYRRDRVIAQP